MTDPSKQQIRNEIQNLYTRMASLAQNMEEISHQVEKLQKKGDIGEVKMTEKVPCPICGDEKLLSGMATHFYHRNDHDSVMSYFEQENGRYKCYSCGGTYKTQDSFRNHLNQSHDTNASKMLYLNTHLVTGQEVLPGETMEKVERVEQK